MILHNKTKTKPKHPGRMIQRTNIFQRGKHRKVAAEIGATAFLPGRSRQPLSSGQELTAQQRFHLLTRFNELRAGGLSAAKAAHRAGSSKTTLWRYQCKLTAGGLPALAPDDRRGRPGIAEQSGLTPSLVNRLQALCLGTGNVQRGFKLFAQTPYCPPRLATAIRQAKTIPMSLRRLVALKSIKVVGLQAGNQIMLIQQGGAR